MSIHHENCDVNDFNLEGIKKPCNCGAQIGNKPLSCLELHIAKIEAALSVLAPTTAYERSLTGEWIDQGDMKHAKHSTDHSVLEEKNREHLRKAIAGGWYTTERDSMFFSFCSMIDGGLLSGDRLMVPQGTATRPILAREAAILVRFTDNKNKHWFAWIHA